MWNTALSRPESSRKDSKHWMQSVRPIGISYKVASCRRNVYSANRSKSHKKDRIMQTKPIIPQNGEFASNRRVCQRTSSVNRPMTVDGIVQTRCLMRQKSGESLPWSCWWRENRTASVPSRRNVEKIENPARAYLRVTTSKKKPGHFETCAFIIYDETSKRSKTREE